MTLTSNTFIGEYKYSLDSKGRINIPAKFRQSLSKDNNNTFVATRGQDPCIWIYPIKEWKKIEDELRKRNIEYNDKRASGRLNPLTVERFLKGAGQAIKDNCLAKGVRETQYKPPVLAYWNEWSDWIGDWIERPTP